MNLQDILARAQAAYVAPVEPTPTAKVSFDSEGRIQWPVEVDATPEIEAVTELPTDDQVPVIGERCRRCSKGRYLHHQTGKVGVCFRCHGKGFFDARDVAFYNLRLQGDKPLCNITGVIAI